MTNSLSIQNFRGAENGPLPDLRIARRSLVQIGLNQNLLNYKAKGSGRILYDKHLEVCLLTLVWSASLASSLENPIIIVLNRENRTLVITMK